MASFHHHVYTLRIHNSFFFLLSPIYGPTFAWDRSRSFLHRPRGYLSDRPTGAVARESRWVQTIYKRPERTNIYIYIYNLVCVSMDIEKKRENKYSRRDAIKRVAKVSIKLLVDPSSLGNIISRDMICCCSSMHVEKTKRR